MKEKLDYWNFVSSLHLAYMKGGGDSEGFQAARKHPTVRSLLVCVLHRSPCVNARSVCSHSLVVLSLSLSSVLWLCCCVQAVLLSSTPEKEIEFFYSLTLTHLCPLFLSVSFLTHQERREATCPSCHDVDVVGGFVSFGEGDVSGACIYCRRALMGDLVDFRAFRSRFVRSGVAPFLVATLSCSLFCL